MGFLYKIGFPVLVSLVIHGLLFGALFVSWESTAKPPKIVPPKHIEAKLVQLKNQTTKKASAKKKPKKIDLTAKRKEQARLQREAEKKKQARIKREKEAADRKAKAEKKKREEKLLKEQQAKAKKEKERRLQQQAFEEALREEEALLLEDQFETEAQSFTSRFRQRVESNWSRPPSARTGMQCTLAIQLVPTGRIVSVNIAKSSGNSAFDRSAVQAVKKVEIFPEAKEMSPDVFERYYRNFNFLFNPQDLRL